MNYASTTGRARAGARSRIATVWMVAIIGLATLAGCGGGGSSPTSSMQPPPPPPPPPPVGSATVTWVAPTTRIDGSALTNLAGFRVYYGSSPTNLTTSITINNPATTTHVVSGLTSGTYYFAVTAYDANGIESVLSSVGSKKI